MAIAGDMGTTATAPTAYAAGARAMRIGPAPRLAVEYAGAGPLVVFLHGIGGDRSTWAPQIEAFSERFCVAAWDARGYGDSDDYDGPLDFADMADDLAHLLDAFAVDRAHLVGLSMGGRICLEFCVHHAHRIATLTLAGVQARFAAFDETARREYLDVRRRRLIDEGLSPADIAPDVIGRLIAPGASDEARRRAVAGMSRLHTGSYLKTLEATTRFDREHVLGDIAVPTLAIGGEHDPLTPPDLVRSIADRIPGAEHHMIYGAGHLSNLEHPVEFNRLLDGFLARYRERANTALDPALLET